MTRLYIVDQSGLEPGGHYLRLYRLCGRWCAPSRARHDGPGQQEIPAGRRHRAAGGCRYQQYAATKYMQKKNRWISDEDQHPMTTTQNAEVGKERLQPFPAIGRRPGRIALRRGRGNHFRRAASNTMSQELQYHQSKQDVFDFIKLLRNCDQYNKWVMQDPNLRKEFEGTDATVGFVYKWESDVKGVGKGEQHIIGITEGERVDYEIRFIQPFQAIAHASLILR